MGDGGPVRVRGSARERPHREVLADRVYELVKAMVMDHEITPGAKINIEALARDLDVSPTPVREALARLESDGLVTKRSLVGYRATELLTADGLSDLFEVRMLLEPHAAALAARHATDGQMDRLESILEAMRSHPVTGDRYEVRSEFAALDQSFHETLTAAPAGPSWPTRSSACTRTCTCSGSTARPEPGSRRWPNTNGSSARCCAAARSARPRPWPRTCAAAATGTGPASASPRPGTSGRISRPVLRPPVRS